MTPLHVLAGVLSLVAGAVALVALKGSSLHRKSGSIFVYTMLVMAPSSCSGALPWEIASCRYFMVAS